MSKLTAESEAEVKHAVGQAETTREHEPVLAPIHLETRSAEQLIELWHETEEAISCRGFIRPIDGIRNEKNKGIDSRIYYFVESVFCAYLRDKRNMQGLDLRSVVRHWLGDDSRPLHLSADPSVMAGHAQMLRWLDMDADRFINRVVAGFLTYLDIAKGKKGTL